MLTMIWRPGPGFARHLRKEYTYRQGYLAHKKQPPPRTLQRSVQGHMVALGRGGVSLERDNPVAATLVSICNKRTILSRPGSTAAPMVVLGSQAQASRIHFRAKRERP